MQNRKWLENMQKKKEKQKNGTEKKSATTKSNNVVDGYVFRCCCCCFSLRNCKCGWCILLLMVSFGASKMYESKIVGGEVTRRGRRFCVRSFHIFCFHLRNQNIRYVRFQRLQPRTLCEWLMKWMRWKEESEWMYGLDHATSACQIAGINKLLMWMLTPRNYITENHCWCRCPSSDSYWIFSLLFVASCSETYKNAAFCFVFFFSVYLHKN